MRKSQAKNANMPVQALEIARHLDEEVAIINACRKGSLKYCFAPILHSKEVAAEAEIFIRAGRINPEEVIFNR